jgi:hypothetical protein
MQYRVHKSPVGLTQNKKTLYPILSTDTKLVTEISNLSRWLIKVKRLEWAGHLTRASESRMIKKVINTKPEGTRKVGRPRLTREECVWQDIRILGVKN